MATSILHEEALSMADGVSTRGAANRQGIGHWLQTQAETATILALLYGFRFLPVEWSSGLGGWLGAPFGQRFAAVPNRRARRNYARLSPERPSEAEIDAMLARRWNHLGRSASEIAVLDRIVASGRVAVVGAEYLAHARVQGPVIVMGLHISSFTLLGPTIASLGHELEAVTYPPENRASVGQAIAFFFRRCYGIPFLAPGYVTARRIYRDLTERKRVVVIHADESVGGEVRAPLFGRAVARRSNLAVIAKLAAATGATVIPAVVERQAGPRFTVRFHPPAPGPDDLADPGWLDRQIERYDAIITPLVLAQLSDWLMLHVLQME
jgi:Kdo2-lipid IVA lauroyltransferase/acyltransferase